MGLTALFCVPVGIGAAIYLEEYAPENRLTQFIEINIANLAGVPSIVYGLLGLALFVHGYTFEYGGTKIEFNLGRSVLAGALTMSLLVLPIVILASREAIRAVPDTYRQASFALGATQVGDHPRRGTAIGIPRNADRHHPGHVARGGRNRAGDSH